MNNLIGQEGWWKYVVKTMSHLIVLSNANFVE